VQIELTGQSIRGTRNTVRLRVAALPDFLVMKAHALAGRDKPKDAYDICYCLTHFPGGLKMLAAAWKDRGIEKDVKRAIDILREKFETVDALGPAQVIEFLDSTQREMQEMQARRAFELVQKLLSLL
jgi:predicted nucleotidyltransferase